MAINKVVYGNTTLIDLTDTTATASSILTGYGAYGRDGVWIDGTATSGGSGDGSVYQDGQGYVVLDDEEGTNITVDSLSVTTNGTYTAPTGHAYSPVTVNVSGGGGSVEQKQINFIDYDGSITNSYSASEWASVTALPSNPSHSGLTAQGWTWTKAQIDAQLTAAPNEAVNVGQMYITESGDTEIDVVFDSEHLSPYLTIAVNGTVTVDWGDNSTDTVTGTSLSTLKYTLHNYASAGSYTISISVDSGTFTFYNNTSNKAAVLSAYGTDSNRRYNREYSEAVKAIRIGSGVTSIGGGAFSGCYALQSITIPSGVTSIGTSAFYNCYAVEEYHILPTTPPTLGGTNAFNGIVAGTIIYVPSESLADYQSATNWSTYASYMQGE